MKGLSILGVAAVGTLAGCASTELSKTNYSRLQLPLAAPATVLIEAGRTIPRSFDFQEDQRDAEKGLWLSKPRALAASSVPGAGTLPSRQRLRQRAELRMLPYQSGTEVLCRVVIEKYDTPAHQMFSGERSLGDTPGDTPIDRGGAATEEQNTVWTYVRRDKVLERNILTELEQAVATPD